LANIPSYTVNNISLGPGILYIGLAGTTPTIDAGAISEDGMEFNVTREFLEVFQGQPRTLITTFPISETVELTIQGIEWDLMQLPMALGCGVTTFSSTLETFSFGGDTANDRVAVIVQHAMPSGNTVSIYLWTAEPLGEWTMSMAPDTLHTFPYSFRAVVSTTDWGGTALPVGQQLFRIVREK
jgi:hypothetical protein